MHKNVYWLGLLAIVAACTVWYAVSAVLAIQQYVALSGETRMTASQWSFEEVSSDWYVPRAKYLYQVAGKDYSGETLFTRPGTRNLSSAKELTTELRGQEWTVWYDPSRPGRSSLQKSFPIKECLSAATLLGIFAYLVWLGFSIGMRRT